MQTIRRLSPQVSYAHGSPENRNTFHQSNTSNTLGQQFAARYPRLSIERVISPTMPPTLKNLERTYEIPKSKTHNFSSSFRLPKKRPIKLTSYLQKSNEGVLSATYSDSDSENQNNPQSRVLFDNLGSRKPESPANTGFAGSITQGLKRLWNKQLDESLEDHFSPKKIKYKSFKKYKEELKGRKLTSKTLQKPPKGLSNSQRKAQFDQNAHVSNEIRKQRIGKNELNSSKSTLKINTNMMSMLKYRRSTPKLGVQSEDGSSSASVLGEIRSVQKNQNLSAQKFTSGKQFTFERPSSRFSTFNLKKAQKGITLDMGSSSPGKDITINSGANMTLFSLKSPTGNHHNFNKFHFSKKPASVNKSKSRKNTDAGAYKHVLTKASLRNRKKFKTTNETGNSVNSLLKSPTIEEKPVFKKDKKSKKSVIPIEETILSEFDPQSSPSREFTQVGHSRSQVRSYKSLPYGPSFSPRVVSESKLDLNQTPAGVKLPKRKIIKSSRFKHMGRVGNQSISSESSVTINEEELKRPSKLNFRKLKSKISYGFSPMERNQNKKMFSLKKGIIQLHNCQNSGDSQNELTEMVFVKPSKASGLTQRRKIINLVENQTLNESRNYVRTQYSNKNNNLKKQKTLEKSSSSLSDKV